MTIRHHVNDELLFEYVAGRLSEAWSVAVATHLALCPACRERAAGFDCAGGFALEALAPAAMADDALQACFGRIDGAMPEQAKPEHAMPATRRAADRPPLFPQPLRDYVGATLADVRWSAVGGGVRQRLLATNDTARARLLYIPPGEPVPEHGHRGLELTLVLAGSFADGETVFARGDLEIADETVQHLPIAGPGEPCICLAVTDAPLRFKSWLPRLVQPLVRI